MPTSIRSIRIQFPDHIKKVNNLKNPDLSVGRLSPPESPSMSAEDKRLDMSSDWLIGDDMTTELVRSLDWSATPIGPREQWPPELKTITNLIMSNPLPSAILWGNDLIFIYNQEYSIIAGDRHPGAMGRCTREVWPDVWDFNKPIFERVLQHGEAVFFENQPYRISRQGKFEDAFFTISYSPIRMSNGKIGGSLCTLIETTERKRANEALRESEVRYRQLVQNTTAIILRVDLQGRITFINDYAQKFFGYSADEIIGQKALGAVIPEKETSGRDLAAMVDDIIANPDRYYTNSNENIKKTGERVWVEWTNSGIYNDEGLLCGFLAVGIDRTESKKIEEALRQARLRSEWLARFPEENPNPIMRVSAEGEILYSNPVSQKSAEWKYETGQSVPDWLFQMIKQATKKGWTVTQDLEIGQRAYSVTIAPFPAEGYVNVYGRDITESKQAEAKLHSDLNALTKMQRLSGTLLAKEGIYPLLQKIMDTAVEIMGAERGTLQLLEGDSLKIRHRPA